MVTAIIDSNYLCYRGVFTTGDLSYGDVGTGVIYGFLNQLLSVGKKVAADQYIFCWDSKRSLRKEYYPFYKQKRSKKDEDEDHKEFWRKAFMQFGMIQHKVLPELGFKNIFVQAGYESDDIMASLVLNNSIENPILVTSDDDLLQMLHKCAIFNLNSNEIVDEEVFKGQYGIRPQDWVEIKKIAGCKSDEIPGIDGVGIKKAVQYIRGEMKEDSKIFQRIQSIPSQEIIKRNDWLVRLPLPGTKTFQIKRDYYISKGGYFAICKQYGIKSLLRKEKLDDWEIHFNMT